MKRFVCRIMWLIVLLIIHKVINNIIENVVDTSFVFSSLRMNEPLKSRVFFTNKFRDEEEDYLLLNHCRLFIPRIHLNRIHGLMASREWASSPYSSYSGWPTTSDSLFLMLPVCSNGVWIINSPSSDQLRALALTPVDFCKGAISSTRRRLKISFDVDRSTNFRGRTNRLSYELIYMRVWFANLRVTTLAQQSHRGSSSDK